MFVSFVRMRAAITADISLISVHMVQESLPNGHYTLELLCARRSQTPVSSGLLMNNVTNTANNQLHQKRRINPKNF